MERFKSVCKRLLWPHWLIAVLLTVLSAGLLVWIFWAGREESWIAYPVYVLSAYTLAVVCIALVPAIRKWAAMRKRKKEAQTPEDLQRSMRSSLWTSQGINIAYAAFKTISGIVYGSAWLLSSGFYYLVLSLIRFVLLRYERSVDRTTDPVKRELKGWSGFGLCGWLLLLLNLTMTGMVFQMIWQDRAESYGQIVVIAIAAYTFYRLTGAIISVVRSIKKKSPIEGAARNISMTAALMSLFSLQTALFAAYGSGFEGQLIMNCLTGTAVCLMTVLGALGMVLHAGKNKKQIRGERKDG